jgi:hypothetical protein
MIQNVYFCNGAAEQAPDDARRRAQWTDEWTDGRVNGRTNGRTKHGPEDHSRRAAGTVRGGLVEVPPPSRWHARKTVGPLSPE